MLALAGPFAPVTYKGKEYITGQGNNAYIFPGVGLGAIFSQASRVDDNDMITAARALAGLVPQENLDNGSCYPNLELAREVSVRIAVEVAKAAWERGTAKRERVPGGDKELEAAIRDSMWAPRV
jgi:malate dehydrogenase (oxaloacetate-decarboxylating)(NADP+)